MATVTVSVVTDAAQVAAAFAIRTEVFVGEQGVPADLERDDRDPDRRPRARRRVDGLPVGAGRLVVEPPGFEGADPTLGPGGPPGHGSPCWRDARGDGLGTALVAAIERRAAERGLRCLYLGAQTSAVPFYERLGYAAYGEPFDGAGLPHRHMWRLLDP